ncbi:PBSX family phage terminase large subunit [Helcococcus kunzii]|uniref:terminase large subunit domain-containing protein n=1 Tax=Helcococcus kunzii TaxID=40091 RepID=UPI001BB0BF0D|nr:terminase family protein [Helcococcus kunzii]QUY65096.1 PBSX family phage terminase large subunit [Helcococcus kunzii]
MATKSKKINFNFGQKHIDYIRACRKSTINVAEGAVRAGKTIDNVFAFAYDLDHCRDKLHLATGSTVANAKLNIGDANGFGLEYIFRGRCKWGKYKSNEALFIKSYNGLKVVIFAGGMKENSYKSFRGNSYGMWIATEINQHHDNTIKEAFNRQLMALDRKVYWDLNPSAPKHNIYTNYIDKYRDKNLKGYNYQTFTIFDNINLTEERKQEIIDQYDKESIWYKRDILGQRAIAEGLIYRTFANKPLSFYLEETEEKRFYAKKVIGMDFGGNKSNHTLVASGITVNYKELHGLYSDKLQAEGTTTQDITKWVVVFIKTIESLYGAFDYFYYDNAESVLGRDVEKAISDAGLNHIVVKGAWKLNINDRIRAENIMIDSKRFKITKYCKTLEEALCNAIWNSKKSDEGIDERLDDGTSDIDTLDAFEYTFERDIKRLIERR